MQSNSRFTLRQVCCSSLLGLAIASISMAHAEEALPEYTFMDAIKAGKNLTSFRLRYENVEQDGNAPTGRPLEDANGLTLRSLVGWQTAPFHNFSFTGQIIDVSKFQDNFNDSTNGSLINSVSNQPDRLDYAKIVDPDYTGINQLFVDWTGIKNNRLRLGRQQINLDNVRFIGDIAFRQVMQVFDGVTLLNKSLPDTEIYLGHIERVQQITTKLRSDGALEIVNAKYRISPTESLVGYGYLSSFDDLGYGRAWFGNAAADGGIAAGKNGNLNQDADQGNKILGVRLDGVHPFTPDWKGLYTAEYAKQTDYRGGDSRIDAHYYKLGGGASYGNLSLRADQELLSSNNGQYAFQTPFGTNHLFQGWVDKFLTTPVEGLKDTFVTATYKWGDFLFFADYHVLKSDESFNAVGGGLGDKYGKEWNAAVTYNVNPHLMTKLEYGKFTESDHYTLLPGSNAAGRIRDTEKVWLTLLYTF
ncbi:alginate export family protein [Methylobacillus caricis]|uniref:alginate export family protein n=1 Tax=Methylobacillus caricis TaxID=1971611 RepID=UPI001CFF867C|nr:alginate export family protein [Methylobacillus caricis]MCB5186427.1 alginate export family protein [Methylobacillus caricis]